MRRLANADGGAFHVWSDSRRDARVTASVDGKKRPSTSDSSGSLSSIFVEAISPLGTTLLASIEPTSPLGVAGKGDDEVVRGELDVASRAAWIFIASLDIGFAGAGDWGDGRRGEAVEDDTFGSCDRASARAASLDGGPLLAVDVGVGDPVTGPGWVLGGGLLDAANAANEGLTEAPVEGEVDPPDVGEARCAARAARLGFPAVFFGAEASWARAERVFLVALGPTAAGDAGEGSSAASAQARWKRAKGRMKQKMYGVERTKRFLLTFPLLCRLPLLLFI